MTKLSVFTHTHLLIS